MKILFVWPNKDSFGYKPIGLSLLMGIARNLNFECQLFDTTKIDFGFIDNTQSGERAKIFKYVDLSPYHFQKDKVDLEVELFNTLGKFQPDCVALSVLCDEHIIAGRVARVVKSYREDIPIIWGGKYPTINPEKTFQNFQADFVCVGEGIDAFREFLICLRNGGDGIYQIPNIWAKKNGQVISNKIRTLKRNLDDLPYVEWGYFPQEHFYKVFDGKVYRGGDHMLNWGCPFRCSYCINHIYHRMYKNKYFLRRYSSERIVDELSFLKEKYQLEFFKFHDEDFLMRPTENLRELSKLYIEKVNLPFVIETNSYSVTEEKISILKEMNCASATIAIETGDPYLRKNILKRVDTEEQIIKAFEIFNKFNLRVCSFNMLGIPFETRETYQKTIDLNRRANVQYPVIGFFFPFDGTELKQISIENDFFIDCDDIVYQHDRPALCFKNLTENELIEMRNVFVLYVKLPQTYHQYIGRSENLDSLGQNLRKKLLYVYDETVLNHNGKYNCTNEEEKRYLRELYEIIGM